MNEQEKRRKILKDVLKGTGVVAVATSVPTSWVKPVVDSVTLPVHAQTSFEIQGCPEGSHYENGKCVPDDPECEGEVCNQGCPEGTTEIDGKCVPDEPPCDDCEPPCDDCEPPPPEQCGEWSKSSYTFPSDSVPRVCNHGSSSVCNISWEIVEGQNPHSTNVVDSGIINPLAKDECYTFPPLPTNNGAKRCLKVYQDDGHPGIGYTSYCYR